MSVIRARKKYFIKPGFQSRLTAIMILLVIIVANLVGGLTYFFAHEKLAQMFAENKLPIDLNMLTKLLLPGVLASELLSIFLIGILCIKITHTIAGPVYRMERVARAIGEGDLTNFIKLRQKDELKDLADSMNEMTLGLRNKVTDLKESLAGIREEVNEIKKSKDLSKLDSTIEKLDNMNDAFNVFILDKEQRARLEDEEEEDSAASDDEYSNNSKDEEDKASSDSNSEYSNNSSEEYK